MDYRKRFLLEKLTVQVMSAAAVAAVYFLLADRWVPSDPQAGMSFVLAGNPTGAVSCAVTIWVLAAIVGAMTAFIRPQGAMLIVLAGAAGATLRSAPIRAWLWRDGDLAAMYRGLILELVIGAGVLFVATIVLDLARRAVAAARPTWLWRSPLEDLTDDKVAMLSEGSAENVKASARLCPYLRATAALAMLKDALGKRRGDGRGHGQAGRPLSTAVLTLVIGMAVVMLLMQSAKRGQILFALVAGFFVATLIAEHLLSSRHSPAVLIAPVLAGVLSYLLGAITSIDHSPVGWANVKLYARALPIDWLFAGGAGVLLACWVRHRKHEWKRMEELDRSI